MLFLKNNLLFLRLVKLAASLRRPSLWRALSLGVVPGVEHARLLRSLDVDGVIDVGANCGQFSLICRSALRDVSILAFEPIPSAARIFRKVHGHSPRVRLIESALGEFKGVATLHVSESADSSSLLPIGRRQTDLFRNTSEIGTISVSVNRLDDFCEWWLGRNRQLLKLDVQGYELNVLRGAVETLKTCGFVYVECSEVALYDGQALRPEVEKFLGSHGFTMKGRFNEQIHGGQLIQADYLFKGSGPTP